MMVGVVLLGAALAVAVRPRLVRWSAVREASARVEAAVPELVDLFGVAASAGHPPSVALEAVARRAPQAVRAQLVAATEQFRRGLPFDECLDELGRSLGPMGESLTDALGRAARSGAPLRPLLDATSAEARDSRRRQAQAAARRLPVSMLLPLVGCVLPAALLLAVVPVLLVSLQSLRG